MFRYFIHKLFYTFITLWGVITVIFVLFTILPGDPSRMMLDQNANEEQIELVKKKYGFDKPVFTQYLLYINDLAPFSLHSNHEDAYTFLAENKYNAKTIFSTQSYSFVIKKPYLRESFQKNGKKVSEIINNTFPNTAVLAIFAIMIAVVFGIFLGIISVFYKDSFLDKFIALLSTIGMSVPSFFAAILAAWLFGFLWHKYTGLSMTGSLYEMDNYGEKLYINWKNAILPSIVLGIRPLGVVTQLMRNSLVEVMQTDYIRTARAKGLSELKIIWKHALKNSLNPVVTALSGWFASMLAGAVFIELIFGWNGLGKEIVDALNTLDLPVIMGSVVFIAFIFLIINIIVDLIYAYLDPKIRLD